MGEMSAYNEKTKENKKIRKPHQISMVSVTKQDEKEEVA